jgi:hypothetical protein
MPVLFHMTQTIKGEPSSVNGKRAPEARGHAEPISFSAMRSVADRASGKQMWVMASGLTIDPGNLCTYR